jgi:putative CocE/NonD family hydrolase
MRDGVALATDIYPPPGGAKSPVLLMRTPYNKAGVEATARRYAEAGYHVVVQDTRGRYESEGAFYPYNNEGQDGYDTLDWIRRQPWSDGRVGMWGASYVGAVQWQAAAEHAPGLAVLAPTATWSSFYRNIYLGGTARLALITQAAALLEKPPAGISAAAIDWSRVLLHLPLSDMDLAVGWRMPWLKGILEHNRPDGFWKRLDLTEEVSSVRIPVQHLVGYYDFFCREVVANFERLRGRTMQQLILGPWEHGSIGKRKVADVDFGPDAEMDVARENLSWFDRVLKGNTRPFPPVRYFSMGDNAWHEAADWPPPEAVSTAFYLHSDGRANGAAGSGRLDRKEPAQEPADAFLSDPANPVPAVAGRNGRKPFEAVWGPVDQSPQEERKDVLVYSTSKLTRPLRIAGPIRAELTVEADTPDADWVVKLIDVTPDGFAQNLAVGIQRTSFQRPVAERATLVAGRRDRITVDLGHAAATLAAGHVLRVEVAGSYFPLYERNTNTGEGPGSARTLLSHQTVHHARGAASKVMLPVIEEGK